MHMRAADTSVSELRAECVAVHILHAIPTPDALAGWAQLCHACGINGQGDNGQGDVIKTSAHTRVQPPSVTSGDES